MNGGRYGTVQDGNTGVPWAVHVVVYVFRGGSFGPCRPFHHSSCSFLSMSSWVDRIQIGPAVSRRLQLLYVFRHVTVGPLRLRKGFQGRRVSVDSLLTLT